MYKRRGVCITIFCQSFCLTKPKKFVWEPFCVSEKNRLSKKFTDNKETLIYSVNDFFSHSTEKFRRGTPLCFKKNRVSENPIHNNGISMISIEKILSHSAEKIRRGPFPCFRKLRVSEIFMDKRRGGLSQFFSKVCLTVPKKFVGQHFCVSEKNRVSKKCMHKKTISFFVLIVFCPTDPKVS